MKSGNAEILFNDVVEKASKLTDYYEAEVLSKSLYKMCVEIEAFKQLAKMDILEELKAEIELISGNTAETDEEQARINAHRDDIELINKYLNKLREETL